MNVSYDLDLAEGFSNDTVQIKVNGQEVYARSGVTSDLLIGRAARIHFQLPAEITLITVTISLPQRRFFIDEQLTSSSEGYLGAFYLDEHTHLKFRPADPNNPPFYG